MMAGLTVASTARYALVALLVAGAATVRVASAEDGAFAGVISTITCSAQIAEVGSNAPVDLKPGSDRGRPVASGDRLRCSGQGQIVVQQGRPKTVITTKDGWVTLRPSAILTDIAKRFDLAATRGEEPPVFSPPSGGASLAESLVIRWNVAAAGKEVRISVWSKTTHQKLCCAGAFDGTKGEVATPELREALKALRDRGDDDRRLVLVFAASERQKSTLEFSVLSTANEAQLAQELTAWDGKGALLRHLGRAHAFRNYRLFTQAAQEAEEALALAPASPYLLGESIAAARRTGKAARAQELAHVLASAEGAASRH